MRKLLVGLIAAFMMLITFFVAVARADLVLNVTFDDQNPQNCTDTSPSHLNGTWHNTTYELSNISGYGMRFYGWHQDADQGNDYCWFSYPTPMGSASKYTCMAWHKPAMDYAEDGTDQFKWYTVFQPSQRYLPIGYGTYAGGRLEANLWNATVSGTKVIAGYVTSFEKDRWYHIASSYNGSNLSLFLNGSIVGSVTTDYPYYINGTPYGFFLGAKDQTYANRNFTFNGTLDEVKCWNDSMTEAQILSYYLTEKPVTGVDYPFVNYSYLALPTVYQDSSPVFKFTYNGSNQVQSVVARLYLNNSGVISLNQTLYTVRSFALDFENGNYTKDLEPAFAVTDSPSIGSAVAHRGVGYYHDGSPARQGYNYSFDVSQFASSGSMSFWAMINNSVTVNAGTWFWLGNNTHYVKVNVVGGPNFCVRSKNGDVTDSVCSAALSYNVSYRITATWNESNISLFVNDSLVGSAARSSPFFGSPGQVFVGNPDASSGSTDHYGDEYSLVPYQKSAAQVAWEFSNDTAPEVIEVMFNKSILPLNSSVLAEVVVTDNNSNEGASFNTSWVNVLPMQPSISVDIVSPSDGEVVAGSNIHMLHGYSSQNPIDHCSYALDSAGNVSFTCGGADFQDFHYGPHTLWVYLVDSVGYVASDYVSFTTRVQSSGGDNGGGVTIPPVNVSQNDTLVNGSDSSFVNNPVTWLERFKSFISGSANAANKRLEESGSDYRFSDVGMFALIVAVVILLASVINIGGKQK